MAHEMYQLTELRSGRLPHYSSIPALEAVLANPDMTDGRFIAAMTFPQLVDSCAAMRGIGENSGSSFHEETGVDLISDGAVVPLIDGKPTYQGAADVNPDWRVAIGVTTGNLPGFRQMMASIAGERTETSEPSL